MVLIVLPIGLPSGFLTLCFPTLWFPETQVAKVPGPGPLGPGARAGTPWARGLGAPGPKMWDTRGECNHLLSAKVPTVRQATYCQASYLQSGKATYSQAKLPTVRQSYLQSGKATYSQACTQQPHNPTEP